MSMYGKLGLEKYSATLSLYLGYAQVTLISCNSDMYCNGEVFTSEYYKKSVFDELISGYSNPIDLLPYRLHRRFMFA